MKEHAFVVVPTGWPRISAQTEGGGELIAGDLEHKRVNLCMTCGPYQSNSFRD